MSLRAVQGLRGGSGSGAVGAKAARVVEIGRLLDRRAMLKICSGTLGVGRVGLQGYARVVPEARVFYLDERGERKWRMM